MLNDETFNMLKNDLQYVINRVRSSYEVALSDINSRSLHGFLINQSGADIGWNFMQVEDILFSIQRTDINDGNSVYVSMCTTLKDYSNDGIPCKLCVLSAEGTSLHVSSDSLEDRLESLLSSQPFNPREYFMRVLHVNPDMLPVASVASCASPSACMDLYNSVRMVLDEDKSFINTKNYTG